MLLAAKLHPPLPRARLVRRAHLTRRLTQALRSPGALVLVSAPAGFGKTTLIGEWLGTRAGQRYPLAWLTLDEGDNDPGRLWAYLVTALERLFPGLSRRVPPELEDPGGPLLSCFDELAAALGSGRPPALPGEQAEPDPGGLLVLDDYHLLTTPALHAGLGRLIEHRPPNLRLIVLGRTDPAWRLARWRAHGQLVELGAQDLRFSQPEAGRFLTQSMGLRLAPDRTAALVEQTEGWAAGLQLLGLAEQAGHGARLAPRPGTLVFDYLAEEVFAQQPPEVQSFLLHTAVLERMTPALCEALFDPGPVIPAGERPSGSGRAWLERLARAQLFVAALDEAGEWYRYHPLMADFLRARLAEGPVEWGRALHRRASAWFAAAGGLGSARGPVVSDYLAAAVDHALAAQDYPYAADLMPAAIDEHLRIGQNQTAISELQALPESFVAARPRLGLSAAWALMLTGRLAEAEGRIRVVELAAAEVYPGHQGEIALLRAEIARQRGQPAATADLARQALTQLPDTWAYLRVLAGLDLGDACYQLGLWQAAEAALTQAEHLGRPGEHPAIYARLVLQLAPVRMMQGRLDEAVQLLTAGLRQVPGPARLRLFQHLAHRLLAQIALERNDLAAAAEHALACRRLMPLGQRALLGEAWLLLAHVQWAAGQPAAARASLAQATLAIPADLEPAARARLAAREARLWLRLRDLPAAERAFRPPSAAAPAHAVATETFTQARLHLARRHLAAAREVLEPSRAAAEADGRQAHTAEALVLLALTAQAANDSPAALAALSAALPLAAASGGVRLFLDEGAAMQALLSVLVERGQPGADHAVRLLAAWSSRPAPDSVVLALAPPAPLTASELAVLRLMAAGHSNNAIASELTVSLNTVRTHAKNLFAKLEAHSRTQAVARARELGLL